MNKAVAYVSGMERRSLVELKCMDTKDSPQENLWRDRLIQLLDKEAKRLGVARQAIIKMWVAERLRKAS